MATPTSQRIGILIIAIVMGIGTLGSFLVMVLSMNNQKIDQAALEKMQTDYQLAAAMQITELSGKYYSVINDYSSQPKPFDKEGVKELSKTDLKIGDGEVVSAETEYSAYYIGWNPEGFIFDQSINEDGTLKAPLAGGNMIEGWNKGIIGMKLGGVRELSIPSDMAYGESGAGENIAPNTPIKFVVLAIPKVKEVPIPDMLLQYYNQAQN